VGDLHANNKVGRVYESYECLVNDKHQTYYVIQRTKKKSKMQRCVVMWFIW